MINRDELRAVMKLALNNLIAQTKAAPGKFPRGTGEHASIALQLADEPMPEDFEQCWNKDARRWLTANKLTPATVRDLCSGFYTLGQGLSKLALDEFVQDVDNAGGLILVEDSWELMTVPEAGWPELAVTYLRACRVLDHTPTITGDEKPR